MISTFRSLMVRQKQMLTGEICRFELCHPADEALGPFEAGAHVNVRTPSGAVRSYSLCNDPAETHRYVIAVKREHQGRGGSMSLVDGVAPGDSVEVSAPVNAFPLVDAPKYVLVAGGIGITPILSMMRTLVRRPHAQLRLIYCTRSPESTAFLAELQAPEFASRVQVHHDQGNAARAFDFWPLFEKPDGTHVYCCGPAALMEHVRALTIHWPQRCVHFEDFTGISAVTFDSLPFRVKRVSTGQVFEIAADKTILEALRAVGIDLPSSCESGTCGTCKTRLVRGEVEHRDAVLNEAERERFLMPCVSRAVGEEIEVDF